MKFYKLRHKPSGLFFKPSKHKSKENLSEKGKVYQTKPSINMLQDTYHHPDDSDAATWNHYPGRIVHPKEWEVVIYEIVEVGSISCEPGKD